MVEEIGVVAEGRDLFAPEIMISLRTDAEHFFPYMPSRALALDWEKLPPPHLS